jgi:hypothetical protein
MHSAGGGRNPVLGGSGARRYARLVADVPLPSSASDGYRVHYLGREREPLVVIDDFSGQLEALTRLARNAAYEPVTGYPGIRCRISSSYLAPRSALLHRILAEQFDLPRGATGESCAFSIVSLRPDQLSEGQRRPHHDSADANLIALLHFTGAADTGGTAFYRHRRTGFETIRPERVEEYERAVAAERREHGPYPPRYFHGSDARYEMIGEVEARPDRVIVYRGRLLHSGHVPIAPDPATARETGRLTINTFLVGRA